MTAILSTTNLYAPFTMEDQCLVDGFLTDGWDNTTDELTFLCNKSSDQGNKVFQ